MAAASMFDAQFQDHIDIASASAETLGPALRSVRGACATALRAGGKLLLFGNGGSAADAQHLASELTIGFGRKRAGIAALALTTDTSALTAAGNDLGFDHVFARQIEALGRPGDVAIGLTTSGTSANVVRALDAARAGGLVTVAFTGAGPNDLSSRCDVVLAVPSRSVPRIQEMHILLGHILCSGIEDDIEP